jgi:gamma-glutamylcyclotransferase
MFDSVIAYFACGSNILAERIRDHAKDARKIGVGYVSGRRLTFHKIANHSDGSKAGKCDIRIDADPEAIAYGVLYEIPDGQFDKLNTYDKDYSLAILIVHSAVLGEVEAIAHIADSTDSTLIPYDWYRDLVLAGARQHTMPTSYIRYYIERLTVEHADSTYKDAREAKESLRRIQNERSTAQPTTTPDSLRSPVEPGDKRGLGTQPSAKIHQFGRAEIKFALLLPR